MNTTKLFDIVGIINKIAPPALAESWDNSGLQLGDPSAEVSRIMVAMDASPAVVESALSSACQLLVTHHPLLFTPLKNISATSAQGKVILAAIRGGLSIFSMHTSYDIADGGMNDILAERLGVLHCAPLQVAKYQELAKLVVFVPEEHLDRMRTALLPFTEQLGRYRDCSFAAPGEGTFTPLDGANPFIGTLNRREQVREHRLELLIDRRNLPRVVKTLVSTHPYEEPAFDIYPLLNEGKPVGLGRIGRLPAPVSLADYADLVAKKLDAPGVRYIGEPSAVVSRVALCGGSGASLMRTALRAGADVLVTGDIKYHEARDAEDMGIALIDAGHFPTESIMTAEITARLAERLASAGFSGCEVLPCTVETNPFRNVRHLKI